MKAEQGADSHGGPRAHEVTFPEEKDTKQLTTLSYPDLFKRFGKTLVFIRHKCNSLRALSGASYLPPRWGQQQPPPAPLGHLAQHLRSDDNSQIALRQPRP